MLLRCKSGEVDGELGRWWDAFQDAPPRDREAMLLKDETRKKRRRNRSRRAGPAPSHPDADAGDAGPGYAGGFSDAVSGSSDSSAT